MEKETDQIAREALENLEAERARRIEEEIDIHTNVNGHPKDEQEEENPKATDDEELSEEEKEAERLREEKRIAREKSIVWQFISGNWMILEGVTGTYRYLLIIAATLFMSVVSIFITFHLSEQLTSSANSAQLLRERSLEYQRIRFNKTSHSAIVSELERRGIPLYDIHESKTIIE